MSDATLSSQPTISPWRITAGRVVEELFASTSQDAWNDLLDLRSMLVHGSDWEEVLECFIACRRKLEEDHYLPFYRLRKILSGHLQFESGEVSLESLLRKKDFSFRRWQQRGLEKGKSAGVLCEVSKVFSGQL